MRILLISPNTLTVPYPVYPIGLDYVAGSIGREHQVEIVDMNIVTLTQLGDILKKSRPQITGISCRNIDNTDAGDSQYFIKNYRELVSFIRQQCKTIIVCGGAGFTIMPDRVFSELNADYGIIGEGERFGLLVNAIAGKQEPTEIAGVISAAKSAIHPPPWSGKRVRPFQKKTAHHDFYTEKGGMLNLQTKRGCSFSCIYCPYPHIEGKKHRLVDPAEVAVTAKQLVKKNGTQMAEVFSNRFRNLGGTINLNDEVETIHVQDKKVTGVTTTDGQTFSADLTIGAIHPTVVLAMLSEKGAVRPVIPAKNKQY